MKYTLFSDVLFYGLVWNLWEPLYSETLRIDITWETSAREYISGLDLYMPPPAFLGYLFQSSYRSPFRILVLFYKTGFSVNKGILQTMQSQCHRGSLHTQMIQLILSIHNLSGNKIKNHLFTDNYSESLK